MMCFINGIFDFVKFIDFWAGRPGSNAGGTIAGRLIPCFLSSGPLSLPPLL